MMVRVDRASRLIKASPQWVCQALVDPDLLMRWLPPRGAHGTIDGFDPRPGGAFAITLRIDDTSGAEGKSAQGRDVVKGRILHLKPDCLVAQSFEFKSTDPAFAGTMIMTWTSDPAGEHTLLTVGAEQVPVGISAEDHEIGLASSLAKLAALAEKAGRKA